MADDRRSYLRLPLNVEVEYHVHGGSAAAPDRVQGKNVSVGGICIVLGERLQTGTQLALSMHLPDSYAPLHFSGRVVWCDEYRVGQDRTYDTGLEFTELTDDAQAVLQRLLNQCGA